MAQDPPPSSQPDAPAQSLLGAETAPVSSDAMATPSPAPVMPVPVQTQPPLYLRLLKNPPLAPGYAPAFNFGAGYSVTSLGMPSSGRAALTGFNASISFDTSARLGATLDLSYASASNVFTTGRRMDLLSYLAGPVFSLWNRKLLGTYAHALFGGARIAGPFSSINGRLNLGRVQYPAWAFGGGVEYRLSPAFGIRVSADYLHTHFYNPLGIVRGQNDFRVVNSIVYYPRAPR